MRGVAMARRDRQAGTRLAMWLCGVSLALALAACGGTAAPTPTAPATIAAASPTATIAATRAATSAGLAAPATAPATTARATAASPVASNATSTAPPAATVARTTTASVTRSASTSAVGTPRRYAAPPPLTIDPARTYVATLVTSLGTISIDLNAKDAPNTVNNFVFLAREGFYDGTIFHRVLPNFVIQGGDPTGTGTGGPGYRFPDETVKGKYEVGSIAMANSGPNTNGSQFFICDGPGCAALPPQYNLFGKVSAGIDVVHAIAAVPTTLSPTGERSRPLQTVTLVSVRIAER